MNLPGVRWDAGDSSQNLISQIATHKLKRQGSADCTWVPKNRRPRLSLQVEQQLARRIHVIRGVRVMLDADLAALYGVPTMRLNQSVKRNRDRFPADFMFQLTAEESRAVRAQIAISNRENLRSQIVMSSGYGGRRYRPFAFTELGVAMLSSVLNSERAIEVNILIMRAFVQLRSAASELATVSRSVEELARRVHGHDELIAGILAALRALSKPTPTTKRRIGFRPPGPS
jgi:hypothetical protein